MWPLASANRLCALRITSVARELSLRPTNRLCSGRAIPAAGESPLAGANYLCGVQIISAAPDLAPNFNRGTIPPINLFLYISKEKIQWQE